MKKEKISIHIGLTLIIILLFAACRKLIEVPGNTVGQLTTEQVFADSVSAINAVIGIYASNISNSSPLSGSVTLFTGLTGDEITSTSNYYAQYINNALIAGSTAFPGGSSSELWGGSYKNTLIYAANAGIEGLKKSKNLTGSLKNQLIGECEVVRSLAYFNLINLFGDVPKVTSSDFLINNKLARSPVDSIYTLITNDLKDAGSRLSPFYPSAKRARPNKYTAMALLSKVYLYQSKWNDAETATSAVINSGIYQMETSLDAVFLDGSSEAIWQAPGVSQNLAITYEGNIFIPYSVSIIPPLYLTPSLWNAFEPGDQRKIAWIHTVTIDGTSYAYPFKYKNSNAVFFGGVESYMIFRLAEQYLIRAEARVRQGNLTGGTTDLNLIRKRAGLPNLSLTGKEELLRSIWHERQIELFCEWGNRWFDLKRTGTINSILGVEKGILWPADGHGALFPIPADQIRLNPNLIQNPGY